MPFRVHQFKSIRTIVDTFKWFKPEIHESSDEDFVKFEQSLRSTLEPICDKEPRNMFRRKV